ncbi:MAG: 2-phospho-L-lactate guanylyltransferase [Actinobacteria bacterium]|nr:2-phospho-L-lactate guanylyltransferase [Actinomycetota bacterium]
MSSGAGVVVPVRAFALGNARLAERLDAAERTDLARRFADRVVAAAGELPVVVVTSAPEVEAWAAELGVATIADPGSLDAAAADGRAHLAERGCVRAVIAHADLPFARTLEGVAGDRDEPVVTLVPCHREDGTPVLSVPVAVPFRFAYGPGSFLRHIAETDRLGLEVRVVRDPDLAFDVDVPADLEQLRVRDWS